jgi:hypothetical protein
MSEFCRGVLHRDDNLADLLVGFHVTMRFHDLRKWKDAIASAPRVPPIRIRNFNLRFRD